ncbi:MAG: VanZ family protein, partial [Nocardioidaceae bacterium]
SVGWAHDVLESIGAPRWVTPSAVEFVLNVALFVPLAFLGSTLIPRWPVRAWGALGFACSLGIELAQLVVLPGRSPNGYDILANTLGALVGAVVAELRNPD